jgi:hypothetical protein
MTRIRSPILWFFLGALTMAVVGLVIALRLTGWPAGGGTTGAAIRSVIHIHDAADVAATRQALIAFIFGAPQLPATLPEPADSGMVVRLPNGFTSFSTISVPDVPNGALVIYHTGHEGFTGRDRAAIGAYLEGGYTVWRLDMPLLGANPPEVRTAIPQAGEVVFHQHRQFAYLDEITAGHPLRYFVEPVVAAVNQAEVYGFSDIFMTGLSGGGWTTILAAAVDPRLDASYPVAGGLPLSLRFDRYQKNWGDWEENLPELFRIASFEDLSILGAAGRSQIQVLNEYDICCYNDSRYRGFAPAIQAVVEPPGGHFEIYWSQGEFLHRANPAALEVVLADMHSRRTP